MARGKLEHTQHQILFGLSVADILTSIVCLLFNFVIPEGVLDARWAIGTDGTCAASGFSYLWFSTAASIYNCLLSLHFFRTIRRKTAAPTGSDRLFLRMGHAVAILIPLIPAVGGLLTDTYHEHVLLYFCYLEEEPSGCGLLDDLECEKGEVAYTLRNVHMLIICVSTVISLACTVFIYCKVRRTLLGSQNTTSMSGSLGDAAARREREVRNQAILYTLAYINNIFWLGVGSFFIMVTPETINSRGAPGVFFLQWMSWFCIPLQGFLNFLVYVRPNYNSWRRYLGKDASFIQVLKKATSGDPAPRGRADSKPRTSTASKYTQQTGTSSNLNPSGSISQGLGSSHSMEPGSPMQKDKPMLKIDENSPEDADTMNVHLE